MNKRIKSLLFILLALVCFTGCVFTEERDHDDISLVTTEDNTKSVEDITEKEEVREDINKTEKEQVSLQFRKHSYLTQHFEKHGEEMGCSSEEEYLLKANEVVNNPKALTKTEAEDGDMIYYLEDTNEIVFVSTDGYIRTYFRCKNKSYFDRQ